MLTDVYFLGKRCNKLSILTDTKEKRSQKILNKLGLGGYFDIPTVLGSRTFQRFFVPGSAEMSSSGGDNDKFGDGVVVASGDEGESHPSRDEHPLPS